MRRASRARQSTAKGKTEMTFEAILQIITEPKLRRIIEDQSRTPFQRAADIHAALMANDVVEAPRKGRTIKPKPDAETSAPTIASEID
jgi:hypothetical protein